MSAQTSSQAPSTADVVVVGGGIIGLASAWRLAQRGLSVLVVDTEPGAGASSVAAGMLAPVTEARLGEEDQLRLGLASLQRWKDFAASLEAATGQDIGLRAGGSIIVAMDADDRALLADVADRQREMGLAIDELSVQELRSLEPALAPPVRRGVLAADECSVDPVRVVSALADACSHVGVSWWPATVATINLDKDRAHGVTLADGKVVTAGTVVLAAGAWSGDSGVLPKSLTPPVRPVKGQILALRQRPGDTVVHHTVRGYVRGEAIYVVPRDDGRLICGATSEERGWDRLVTAGAAYQLLRDVLTLYPGLDDAEIVQFKTGFRPGTPDGLPLLGTATSGLVMATGHYRGGVLLAPVTADAVEGIICDGGVVPPEVAVCDPQRFLGDC